MNIKDDFILSQINDGYLVGGSIRDFLMEKGFSADRDIAIKNAENFAKKLAEQLDATFIILDSENHIYRLVLKDKINYLDISELQGNSIEEDLLRRDFTINAIAYDLKENKLIDVTGGINDIETKTLRHIKDENFSLTEKVKLGNLPKYKYLKDQKTSEIVGEGKLTLNRSGLTYEGTRNGEPFNFHIDSLSLPTYGMCTDLSRFYTFYNGDFMEFYPQNNVVEKFFLATEEIHRINGGKWQDFKFDK